ncbi:unnamed protein product, partial [Effrenium voratum]
MDKEVMLDKILDASVGGGVHGPLSQTLSVKGALGTLAAVKRKSNKTVGISMARLDNPEAARDFIKSKVARLKEEAMVRHLQEARLFPQRPRGLRRVMDHWEAQMAQEQVRRQGSRQEPSDTKGRGRGHIGVAARLRCRLRAAVEPAPSVTVRLRPPYAAEVAALVVLFAWQAVGARPFFWILLCCQLGSLWFPFPLVAAGAVSANLLRYQVKRRLARLNMLRMRPQMEGDLLIFALLILGACCA